MPAPIALQLYTVRDALARNFKDVVTCVAEIGYVGVETAGFPGTTPEEASDLFADLGLEVCSAHTQLPVGKQKNVVIELAQALEIKRIVSSTPRDGFDSMDPANVSPLVAWLGSVESRGVTGRVFEVQGGLIGVYDGWRLGPTVDRGERWPVGDIGPAVERLLAEGPDPVPVYGA